MLAVAVLRDQGCHVEGVVFESPFFKLEGARRSAEMLGLPLRSLDFTGDITRLIENPAHGFGKAMNPCIDCHAAMFRRAGELVRELGWDFVASGEVLNQRPMSQTRQALRKVADSSGCGDILLRPLSAKLLEPTAPELDGRVDRDRLLDISGRSRQRQIELASHYGITSYPSAAGGCLLTETMFSGKLRDLKDNEGLANARDLELLKIGRHFRLPDGAKLILGRDHGENKTLAGMIGAAETLLSPIAAKGPDGILTDGASATEMVLAARICASFSDHDGADIRVSLLTRGTASVVVAAPLDRAEAQRWRVGG